MQKCLTPDEDAGAIKKTDGSSDPYLNVLTDYKGTNIKDLCLDIPNKDDGSVCISHFKDIAKGLV